MQSLDFSSIAPISEPVKIPGSHFSPPRDGIIECVLRQASESAASEYESRSLEGMEVEHADAGHGRVLRNLSSSQNARHISSFLISKCLFEKTPAGEIPVAEDVIKLLPRFITKPIFERAQLISGLNKAERDVDTPWVKRCRRDLAHEYHESRGGDPKVMQGINIALDWLKKKLNEEDGAGFDPKNLQPVGETISALPKS